MVDFDPKDISIDDELAYQLYKLNYDAELPSLPYSIGELPTLDYHWLGIINRCNDYIYGSSTLLFMSSWHTR